MVGGGTGMEGAVREGKAKRTDTKKEKEQDKGGRMYQTPNCI